MRPGDRVPPRRFLEVFVLVRAEWTPPLTSLADISHPSGGPSLPQITVACEAARRTILKWPVLDSKMSLFSQGRLQHRIAIVDPCPASLHEADLRSPWPSYGLGLEDARTKHQNIPQELPVTRNSLTGTACRYRSCPYTALRATPTVGSQWATVFVEERQMLSDVAMARKGT